MAVGGTLGSVPGRFCGTLGTNDVVELFVVGLKREARWRRCFRVSVLAGGTRVEWDFERRAAVRSLAADVINSVGVTDGIRQWCGNQRSVWDIRVQPVEGNQMLWPNIVAFNGVQGP